MSAARSETGWCICSSGARAAKPARPARLITASMSERKLGTIASSRFT
jgi:hypothetical protein